MRSKPVRLAAALLPLLWASPGHADLPPPGPVPPAAEPGPSQLCRAAIAATERSTRIPDAFLSAISRVESGRPAGGTLNPWPWTVNAAGAGHFYATKGEAIAAVRQFLAAGLRSLDVGCLQVNLFYHPDAFASLEQAFDPAANAAYAARLLRDLFRTQGSWPRAAAAYHSLTPALGLAYQQKVLEAWAMPDRAAPAADIAPPAASPATPPATSPAASPAASPAVPAPAAPAAPSLAAPSLAAPQAIAAGAPPAPMRHRLAPQQAMASGRALAAYRAAPVQLAWRQLPALPVRARQ
jgi:hypothetical protein